MAPLHVAVRKGHLKSSLNLVLEGADVNVPNTVTLGTPLHSAVQGGAFRIVQLLLVFGAEPRTRNRLGKTPIELAKEARGDISDVITAIETVIAAQEEEAMHLQPLTPLPKGSVVVLSLDGGGIRALVLAQLLLFLQQRVTKLSSESVHFPSVFNWVAGTSTGAFLALAVFHFKTSPQTCKKMYFKFKDKAMCGHRVYPTHHLEAGIKEAFGEDEKVGDICGTKLVMTTCIADQLPPVLHLMCNYGGPRNDQVSPSQLPIWEAARASSAAPTYFEEFRDKFLDGGMMSNNPTVDLMTEIYSHAQKHGQQVKIGCVVSLGTGIPPTVRTSGSVNITTDSVLGVLSDVKAMENLANLFITQCTMSYGQEVHRSRAWCESIGTPFFRFSPPIDDISLDETDDSKLIKMLYDTMIYTLQHRAEYDQLANLLLTKK